MSHQYRLLLVELIVAVWEETEAATLISLSSTQVERGSALKQQPSLIEAQSMAMAWIAIRTCPLAIVTGVQPETRGYS